MASLVVVAVFLLWGAVYQLPQAGAFTVFPSDASLNHQEITETAIVRKVAEVCRDIATAQGKDFTLPVNEKLTAATVEKACSSSVSSVSKATNLRLAIVQIYLNNIAVDKKLFSEAFHFDNEAFSDGRDLITEGIARVKANLKKGNYIAARKNLGTVTHTLQDFYSHSNWVELGYTDPYAALINPDIPLTKIANILKNVGNQKPLVPIDFYCMDTKPVQVNGDQRFSVNNIVQNIFFCVLQKKESHTGNKTVTCKSCVGNDCRDNILQEVLQQKILTSGYFSLLPFKPSGKCSHGGTLDLTSKIEPVGGINKDDASSEHGYLHTRAANLAINATTDLLQKLRLDVGETVFLRLMGLTQTKVLAFVIDTTSSMSDYIAEIKNVSINITNSRKGTAEEPTEYMLITFNNTEVELTRTGDIDKFKERVNSLSITNGDLLELGLSGLLMALTRAPPLSDIFVFTDAIAKDILLKGVVEAMIESTESTVTFLLTSSGSARRRREISDSQSSPSRLLSQLETVFYKELSQVSGGQTLEVTNTTLSQASNTISDAFTSGQVTILQLSRTVGLPGNYTFLLDSSLSNVTVYITGDLPVFTLFSPTGVFQLSSTADGPLGIIQTVGNLRKMKLKSDSPTGEWRITIVSVTYYTVKVTGQSSVNILSYFVEISQGGHSNSWAQTFTRPSIGQSATLFLSLTGGQSVTETDVLLVNALGVTVANGTIKSVGVTDYLVTINKIPEGAFGVLLKGQLNSSSSTRFQRQSPINHKGSKITIRTQTLNTTTTPGVPVFFTFIVSTKTIEGPYIIRARNNQGFNMTVPPTLPLKSGVIVPGIGMLMIPSDADSGTDIMLTIDAEAPGFIDLNYATLRLTVSAASKMFSSWFSFFVCLSLSWVFGSLFV